ncbi:glycosyltransferase family 2 protein [Halocynthiibacter styelae]|uniref:Glycosyltransferase n=1 Tax=Halocynthiibacter styelae TaxID=2761955 RepID=A0A8J7IDT0_9RHOB|nr:glycosyltransferase family 2 protein [Paenihalocynthiibacter styelae]MBI1494728.1 glycosyltransferase [Paenihalocynthiibacter styelae]
MIKPFKRAMITVSILMPAFNAAHTIDAAIASVCAQNERDWQLLVIDDSSTDATCEIVSARAQTDPRIRLLHNTGPRGAAFARNTGLEVATGRYIAFLDSDDQWLPDKLTQQFALLKETGAPLCYGGYYAKREAGPGNTINVPPHVTYEQLLRGNVIGCLTAIYDTRICGKVPMPPLKRRHDFALWLQILKTHGPACGVTRPVAVLRLASGTLSSNKLVSSYDTWRMYRDIEKLSAMKSAVYLFRHLTQRVWRYRKL